MGETRAGTAGPGPHGAGAATGTSDSSTGATWSWTGPSRSAPSPFHDLLTAALWAAIPVSALLPVSPEPLHLAVVLTCVVLAVAVARWPRALAGGLRLGPEGVSEWTVHGLPRRSRRTTRVPGGEVHTLEIDQATRVLVLADEQGYALHRAPLDALGDLVTTVLAARARGLSVAFTTEERGRPADTSWLDRLEGRLTEAVLEPPTAAPAGQGAEGSVRHPESPASPQATIFVAAMAVAGTTMVAGLVSPALQVDGHATWSTRAAAAVAGLVAAAALFTLARGRARTAACTWTVSRTAVVADDTRRGRWEVPRARIAAALPLSPGGVPHVLLVDRLLRPVAEIPCVAPSIEAVARLLRRGGVTWMEPDRLRDPGPRREVPPWRRAAPGGRLRVSRDGLLWVDDLVGHLSVIVPADLVTALRVSTRDGVPWLSAVVPADQVGGARSTPEASDVPRSAELFVGPLAELATTRSRVAAEAAEAGLVVQDLEQEVYREAVLAEDSAREGKLDPAESPASSPMPPAAPPHTASGPALIRHSLRTALGLAAVVAGFCLVVTSVLAWRAAAVSSPSSSPTFVFGVGTACALLAFVVCLPGDTLRVQVDRVSLTSRSGRRTRWTVLRDEVAAVGWLREEDRQVARLAFYDARGVPVRSAVVPGAVEDVERALADRGWPIGPPRPSLVRPPEA